jgi:hypothetical protein
MPEYAACDHIPDELVVKLHDVQAASGLLPTLYVKVISLPGM